MFQNILRSRILFTGILFVAILTVAVGVKSVEAASLTTAQVNAIISLLQSFNADSSVITSVKTALTGGTTTGGSTGDSTTSFCYTFTRDLKWGSRDSTTGGDVSALQRFLSSKGYTVSITGYFGYDTQRSLAKFQKAVGISPANGYFGPVTRAYVNKLTDCATKPLTIVTTSLPNGAVDFNYSTTIEATGGKDYYKWIIGKGNLPFGLSYSPPVCIASPCQGPLKISGVPTTPGTYSFQVDLYSGSEVTTRSFSITVSGTTTTFQPYITSVAGKAAGNGEIDAGGTVGIQGTNLLGSADTSYGTNVYIGSTQCAITQAGPTLIYCTASSDLTVGKTYDLYIVTSTAGRSNMVQVKVLSNVSQPSITVLSPNGGESYKTTDSVNVSWNQNNAVGPVRIHLLNYPNNVEYYASGAFGGGTNKTGVTLTGEALNVPSGQYRIQVCDEGVKGALCDFSDEPFTITASTSTPSTGLISHHPLDGNLTDITGNGYNGTGTNISYTAGKSGSAINLNGSNYVNLGKHLNLSSNPFTISLWYKGTDTGGSKGLIGSAQAGSTGYALLVNSNKAGMYLNGTTVSSTRSINDNTWHHIVATRDASSIKIYIDGSLDSTHPANNANTTISQNTWIGGWGHTSYLVNGLLDDVRVYNQALSASQIASLYGSPVVPPPPTDSTPVVKYPITITKSGTGTGTVTSSGGSINCGSLCTTTATSGMSITLTATPASGSNFTTWSGVSGCTTNTTCTFTLTATTTINAGFGVTSITPPPTGTSFYIRQGATGNNSGSDWTNAHTSLPSTLVRGATYFIADGSYGGYTFNTPEDGTKWITVKKAIDDTRCTQLGKTIAECRGTNTGWQNSYGDGQAVFGGGLTFTRDYYEINGQKRNENNWTDASSYGIKVDTSGGYRGITSSEAMLGRIGNNVILKYLEIGADYGNSDISSYQDLIYLQAGSTFPVQNWLIHRSYIHNGRLVAQHAGVHNITYEYNYIANTWNKAGIRHQGRGSSVIVRYNIFRNVCQGHLSDPTAGNTCTAIVGWYGNAGSNNEDYSNSKVYGNVFIDTFGTVFYNSGGAILMGDDRTSQGGGLSDCSGCKVFNNHFIGMGRLNPSSRFGTVFDGIKTNTESRNNLWYNIGNHVPICNAAVCSNNPLITNPDVFVNAAGEDFRLSFNGAAGIGDTISLPYNKDMFGNIRGADGTWDIGAYEYVGTTTPPPTGTPTGTSFYIRQGATGNNSGSDWTNAYTSLPSTLVRGATYFIADGSYGGYTFNTPEDGTKWITVKKAIDDTRCTQLGKTIAECRGTNTGWQNSYGDGQAVFGGSLGFAKDYYEIDGQIRNENKWDDGSSYTIKINPGVNGYSIAANKDWHGDVADHLRFKYLDIGGVPGSNASNVPNSGLYIVYDGHSDIYVGYSYIHHIGIPILNVDTRLFTLEKSYIGPSWSKEAIRARGGPTDGWIVRNNYFIDNGIDSGESLTAEIGVFGNTGNNDNWQIYGNVFRDTGQYTIRHNDSVISVDGNTNNANNWKVYNNTLIGLRLGQIAISITGANNQVHNNLWYDMKSDSYVGVRATDAKNNWVQAGSLKLPEMQASWPTTIAGVGNPLINFLGGDYRLADSSTARNAGVNLGAGFDNVDMFGNIRGADGTWDIGAYEYKPVSGVTTSLTTQFQTASVLQAVENLIKAFSW